jgi:hypothetical protein
MDYEDIILPEDMMYRNIKLSEHLFTLENIHVSPQNRQFNTIGHKPVIVCTLDK